ncbi:acetolactate synthase large subunit [Sulfuracidifex metallicus]|uniref:Acetolactate synthase n=1 Tax=Sulfuracidifex metallicus DSM 6482 = JCM 9184 TaxID=523847 RepID=A0A6A9QLL2_SULME|nr:acetolactate synthase large subunit [Sulfuracidifex metallicus]MUN28125.1 acetolactate synthase large subunit [Sulfuracidifex metallicus DSM 6482 = JCM 9184]WOE51334.1 acetolactate synthase large subunit [Sulfuracidifex metallicus DSM 6482 = JCM 9184]
MPTGARLTIDALKREGVKVIFGIPGLSNMQLYDAFVEDLMNGELRHVLMRHEQAAAHAADGYARASGIPGVCTATSGPGATNLVTGLITAYWDSSPVVAITGQVPRSTIGKMSFQEADAVGATEDVVKYAYQVRKFDEIPPAIKNAFYVATTGRPGPVVVDIPRDIFYEKTDNIKWPEKPTIRGYRPFKTIIDPIAIKKTAEMLINAERPVIMVGTGVVWSNASKEVLDLAETLIAPIVSTLPGKSAIPHDHPLYLGAMGYYGRAEASMVALESDMMFVVGARLSDRTFTSYDEMIETRKKFAMINIDPTDSERTIRMDVALYGDAKILLREIHKAVLELGKKNDRSAWMKRVKELKDYYSQFYFNDDKTRMRPWKVLKTIRQNLPRDAIVTTGVGQHQMWAEVFWEVLEPRTFLSSTGMGTMGFGLPAAIGAKMARPDKVVVDLDGDGSMMMTGTNFATAVDENIPVISIVFDNRSLGLVRQVQDLFFNKRVVGVDYGPSPDLVKFAESFGALGYNATTYEELEKSIKSAIKENHPALIRVPIDKQELALPTLPPGGRLKQVIVTDPRKGS